MPDFNFTDEAAKPTQRISLHATMNGTTTIAEFRDAVLDPANRAHYRLAWLSTVDHKRIAVLYMLTALVFFVIAGVEALFMRLQLAALTTTFSIPTRSTIIHHARHDDDLPRRHAGSVRPRRIYVLPLQIGARDMAFPRLKPWFLVRAVGGILLHFSVLAVALRRSLVLLYTLSETPYPHLPESIIGR